MLCVVIPEPALIQRQASDRNTGGFVRLVQVKQPRLTPVRSLFQKDDRTSQAYFGKHQILFEQVEQVDSEFHVVHRKHLLFLRPRRISERHSMRAHAWRGPRQFDFQVSANHQFAARLFGDDALQRTARPIPAENRDVKNGQHWQCQQQCD